MTGVFELEDRDSKVVEAVLALLNDALRDVAAVEADDVPSPRPAEYVQTALARRFGGQRSLGGRLTVVGYRLTVTAVSEAYIGNVRRSLGLCGTALEFRRLTIADLRTTPIQFESQRVPGPDGSRFSGATTYTFAL